MTHPSSVFPRLFPQQSRSFQGQRWLNILLRTLHLIGIAGIGAAFLYQTHSDHWIPYMYATLASGLLMVMLELWSNGIWLLQVRCLATLLKLLILSLSFWLGPQPAIIVLVIIISGIISHAPAKVRYFPFT